MSRFQQKIEKLPFFEEEFKGMVTPLGRFYFTLENGYVEQLFYLYNNEIYVTERWYDGECANYRITWNVIGSIMNPRSVQINSVNFYYFSIGNYVSCRPVYDEQGKYLEFYNPECAGVMLYENGMYNIERWKNNNQNYMHKNDKIEYETSHWDFVLRVRGFQKTLY